VLVISGSSEALGFTEYAKLVVHPQSSPVSKDDW